VNKSEEKEEEILGGRKRGVDQLKLAKLSPLFIRHRGIWGWEEGGGGKEGGRGKTERRGKKEGGEKKKRKNFQKFERTGGGKR